MPHWCITSSVCHFHVGILFVNRSDLGSRLYWYLCVLNERYGYCIPLDFLSHARLASQHPLHVYIRHVRSPEKQLAQSCVSYIEFTVGFMGSVWLLSESWPMRTQDLEMSLFRLRDLPIWLSGIWVFSQLLFNVFLSHYWNTEDILSEQPQLLGDISHFAVMTLPDEFVTVCECKNQLFGFLPSFPSLMYCLMPLSKVCYLILFLILLLLIFTFGYSLPCMNFAVEDEKECIHWTITMPTRVCITFFFCIFRSGCRQESTELFCGKDLYDKRDEILHFYTISSSS